MRPLTSTWLVTALWLWLACGLVYFVSAPGRIDIIDGGIRYDVTESLIETGKPLVRNSWFPSVRGRSGGRYAFYPIGTSLSALPFVQLGGWLGHGSTEAKQFAFSMTSVPFAAAVVSLVFLIWGRLGCPIETACGWSLVVAFCTLLWPYAGSSFDVAIQAFWLTLATWSVVEAVAATSLRWALVSGLAFAALINVQEVYAILPMCTLAAFPLTVRSIRDRLRTEVVQLIGVGLLCGVAIVLAYNALRFGNPLETGRTTVPHPLVGNPSLGLLGLFLSPAKSILLYSPTYPFALIGLQRLVTSNRRLYASVGACLGLHILLISSLRFWAGEWAWGPRYLVASLPLACIGLPFVVGQRMKIALKWAAGLGLVVQLLAISVDHQRYYFERSLTAYFWLDEAKMYTDSPLFARPFELFSVLRREDSRNVRALVPAPNPRSMTSSLFGPPPERLNDVPAWMREYLVFSVPRPWPLWSRYLAPAERPGPTGFMTVAGVLGAIVAFSVVSARVRSARQPLEHKQVI